MGLLKQQGLQVPDGQCMQATLPPWTSSTTWEDVGEVLSTMLQQLFYDVICFSVLHHKTFGCLNQRVLDDFACCSNKFEIVAAKTFCCYKLLSVVPITPYFCPPIQTRIHAPRVTIATRSIYHQFIFTRLIDFLLLWVSWDKEHVGVPFLLAVDAATIIFQ
jgi:hypothetical protein